MNESDEKNVKLVVGIFSSSSENLSSCLESEPKMRDVNSLWRVYSELELGIGLAKFLVDNQGHLGKFGSSIANDPATIPLDALKGRLMECQSDLEYALYDFETTGGTKNGLAAARKCRDSLKAMILGHRKKELGRSPKRLESNESD